MTVNVLSSIIIVFIHWIADFVCQTREMANNKSKSALWLSIHVFTYSFVLLVGCLLTRTTIFDSLSEIYIISFVVINGLIHFLVDFVTSKITSYFYKKEDVYKFFCTVGFDQFLHVTTLLVTLGIVTSR